MKAVAEEPERKPTAWLPDLAGAFLALWCLSWNSSQFLHHNSPGRRNLLLGSGAIPRHSGPGSAEKESGLESRAELSGDPRARLIAGDLVQKSERGGSGPGRWTQKLECLLESLGYWRHFGHGSGRGQGVLLACMNGRGRTASGGSWCICSSSGLTLLSCYQLHLS